MSKRKQGRTPHLLGRFTTTGVFGRFLTDTDHSQSQTYAPLASIAMAGVYSDKNSRNIYGEIPQSEIPTVINRMLPDSMPTSKDDVSNNQNDPLISRFPTIAFRYDVDTSRLVIQYSYPEDGKTVRQIPTELALRQYKKAQRQQKDAERAAHMSLSLPKAVKPMAGDALPQTLVESVLKQYQTNHHHIKDADYAVSINLDLYEAVKPMAEEALAQTQAIRHRAEALNERAGRLRSEALALEALLDTALKD